MSTRYDDRDYSRYDRDEERYGRRSDYAYGGRRDYGRESDYGRYGREGYQGGEYDRGYGREGSYGSRYGRDYDYERGRYDYSEPSERYSERYNYPSGYRSGERTGSRYGRDYDYERGHGGRGGERGWWDRASDEVASWFGDEEAERRRRMDEQRARFRGRGPKGYRRSDDRIRDDVNDRLTDDPYLDASEIEVSVKDSEVTLSGTVDSRYDRRRAEDIAESVSGVTHVQNNLRVSQITTAGTTAAGTTTGTTGAAARAGGTST